jgi:hypothetical protein
MGTTELYLQQQIPGRPKPRLKKLHAGRKPFVIGSSEKADLRISGTDVAGCHAILVCRDQQWYVCDVSGKEDLKVNGVSTIETAISGRTQIEIGNQTVEFFSPEKEPTIFMGESNSAALKTGGSQLHQVVIRVNSRVAETQVLKSGQIYKFFDGEIERELPCPTTGEWVKTDLGGRVVMQRLVSAQEVVGQEKISFDADIKRGSIIALLLMMFLIGGVLVIPKPSADKPQLTLDQKSLDVIYNAQKVKLKREESKKIVKAAKARAGGTNSNVAQKNNPSQAMPEEAQAPKVSANTTQALTSIRNSGLSQLIGKIAKRANKQGIMIGASGVSADQQAGRALYSVGTSLKGGGGTASKEGAFRLGGVATAGRSGGIGSGVKDGTAMAGGAVGTGNVAMLEEETVIEGGLDKDAIAEVIKRNIGQIRYCYERQLSADPNLYGKVSVRFVINAAGAVLEPKIDASSMKSSMVEGCIVRRLASWKFPLPKGGTEVRVSYPFMFKALQ